MKHIILKMALCFCLCAITSQVFAYTQISAGGAHACALKENGKIVCWGAVGKMDSEQTTVPDGIFKQVTAGAQHTCALKKDDSIMCWGYGYNFDAKYPNLKLTTPPQGSFKQISAGWDKTCALKYDDSVLCWGSGSFPSSPIVIISSQVNQISVGAGRVCILQNDGHVTCYIITDTSKEDTPISGTFNQISLSGGGVCALKNDSSAICWVSSNSLSSFLHKLNVVPSGIFSDISIGESHVCALKNDSSVTCWGNNDYGQTTPPIGKFKQISAGFYHTCALTFYGNAVCWGAGKTDIAKNGETTPATLFEYGQSIPPVDTYVLTLNTSGSGRVIGAGSYAVGSSVPITAVADTGWNFTGWTPEYCKNQLVMPSADLVCTANFSKNQATGQSVSLAFRGIAPHYNIGDTLKIDFDMNIKAASRFERVDLWIAVQLPTGGFLYATPLGLQPFSSTPQAFKSDIEQLNMIQTLISFEVFPNMGGTYTFYAVCVQKGKNPLPQPSGDGESFRCSDVIIGKITLDN